MIVLKFGRLSEVKFLGKEAYITPVKYERTDSGQKLKIHITIPEIDSVASMTDSLEKFSQIFGDDVKLSF